MPKKIELKEIIGVKFGKLTPITEIEKRKGVRVFLCECDCGRTAEPTLHGLRRGNSKSCGCERIKNVRDANSTHGLSNHKLFKTWKGARDRCHNESDPSYKNYGKRGVKMFSQWIQSPKEFINWVEQNLGEKPKGATLDRCDNGRGYEPGNIRWASTMEQVLNRRSTVNINHNGITMSQAHWCDALNFPRCTIAQRIRRGWDIKKALDTPLRVKRRQE